MGVIKVVSTHEWIITMFRIFSAAEGLKVLQKYPARLNN